MTANTVFMHRDGAEVKLSIHKSRLGEPDEAGVYTVTMKDTEMAWVSRCVYELLTALVFERDIWLRQQAPPPGGG